ncbi:MAG: UDP-N-acetylmuramate--L-alanine ligase [Clostridia bacterium]|nr:UDP-N-acetylmuramate--L-alanine ligase [Clostridia bacterium]
MATPNTHFGSEAIRKMLCDVGSIFFIGIGGISMSSLARLAHRKGLKVGGSDRVSSEMTRRLSEEGIEVFIGHAKEHLRGYEAAVYTVAIPEDNPEYEEAVRRGIPLISRADYLGYLMSSFRSRIGVSGTHGKSTCTSMISQIFIDAGEDPTIISGAEFKRMDGACHIGKNEEHFVFEACEYYDSFLDFSPTVAVVLNEEYEHVDFFRDMEQVRQSFRSFMHLTCREGRKGIAVINGDDEDVNESAADFPGTVLRFGFGPDLDYRAVGDRFVGGYPAFDVEKHGGVVAHVQLSVPGRHNIYNALAAYAVADSCGIDKEPIVQALERFSGAVRRMEYKGTLRGIPVYDDYGHHPTEIRATLNGISQMGFNRIFCVFQPHTYSRLHQLYPDFVDALSVADVVMMDDVYAAREDNVYGVTSEMVARSLGQKGMYPGTRDKIAECLSTLPSKGDVIVIMGAGNIEDIFKILPLDEKEQEPGGIGT